MKVLEHGGRIGRTLLFFAVHGGAGLGICRDDRAAFGAVARVSGGL